MEGKENVEIKDNSKLNEYGKQITNLNKVLLKINETCTDEKLNSYENQISNMNMKLHKMD
jgi:hypothetical protein